MNTKNISDHSLLHGQCHVRKEWEELNYPTPWVYCTHPQISCLVAGPSLKGLNCSIQWTAWLGSMSTALRVQVKREGSSCKSFCWWRGQHSPCSISKSAGIHSTQILLFTEGGADPEVIKSMNTFPLSILWQGVLNKRILGILELQSHREPSISLYSKSWILSATRGRNPD